MNTTADPPVFDEALQLDDFCQLCAPTRRAEGLPPNIKVALTVHTKHKGLAVKVCPDCDGEAAQLGTR